MTIPINTNVARITASMESEWVCLGFELRTGHSFIYLLGGDPMGFHNSFTVALNCSPRSM